MNDVSKLSVAELAAYVSTHLATHNIDVVLVGGSCVSIYSDNQYASYDLDFIEVGGSSRKQLKTALSEIGFTETNRYFSHPHCRYFLEFPSGPLAIGDQPVANLNNITLATGTFKLLTPEDCIKDRLLAYFYWKDMQSLQQALWVAQSHQFDRAALKAWAVDEGVEQKYAADFESKLNNDK